MKRLIILIIVIVITSTSLTEARSSRGRDRRSHSNSFITVTTHRQPSYRYRPYSYGPQSRNRYYYSRPYYNRRYNYDGGYGYRSNANIRYSERWQGDSGETYYEESPDLLGKIVDGAIVLGALSMVR